MLGVAKAQRDIYVLEPADEAEPRRDANGFQEDHFKGSDYYSGDHEGPIPSNDANEA
jgi:hypothetical protein